MSNTLLTDQTRNIELLATELLKGNLVFILWHEFDQHSPRYKDYRDNLLLRNELVRQLQDEANNNIQPSEALQLLAKLPLSTVYTVSYDSRLKNAIRDNKKGVQIIGGDKQLQAGLNAGDIKVFHLLGYVDDESTLTISQKEYQGLRSKKQNCLRHLINDLGGKTCVFLGISDIKDFDDDSLLGSLYSEIESNLQAVPPSPYIVLEKPFNHDKRARDAQKVIPIHLSITNFLEQLNELLHQSESKDGTTKTYDQLVEALEKPKSPYMFLDYFQAQHRRIYFGRKAEAIQLTNQITGNKYNVLSSPSGRGKTSLLLAGVIPRLEAQGWKVVSFRLDKDLSLFQKAESEIGALENSKALLVFDQAEELFTRTEEFFHAQRIDFILKLMALVNKTKVHLLVGLRYEYDGLWRDLVIETQHSELEKNTKWFMLGQFGETQAREAIEAPAKLFDLEIDPKLTEALLKDLQSSGFDPAQIQILCHTLYEKGLERHSKILEMSQFVELGGSKGILDQYLEDALQRITDVVLQTNAKNILKNMITAQQTKLAISRDDLYKRIAYLDLTDDALRITLNELQNHRLIRVLNDERFELAHDRLVSKIWNWLTDADKARLNAAQLLKQGMHDFEHDEQLIGNDSQIAIYNAKETLSLTAKEFAVLIMSALAVNDRDRVKNWMDFIQNLQTSSQTNLLQEITIFFNDQKHSDLAYNDFSKRGFWLVNSESASIALQKLQGYFFFADIKELCLWLEEDYELFEGKKIRVSVMRNLVSNYKKTHKIDILLALIAYKRPNCLNINLPPPEKPEQYLVYETLLTYFDLREIKDLCGSLKLTIQEFSADTIGGFAYSLVINTARLGRLNDLKLLIALERPHSKAIGPCEVLLVSELDRRFDLEGIETLCFDLDLNHENLGTNKKSIIESLIGHFAKKREIKELVYAAIFPEGVGSGSFKVLLRRRLVQFSNGDELHSMCFEIGVDYEEVAGGSFIAKCRNFIVFFIKRDMLSSFAIFLAEKYNHILNYDDLLSFIKDDLRVKYKNHNLFSVLLGETFTDLSDYANGELIIDTSNFRNALRSALSQFFTMAEIEVLCHELDINYEDIDGNSKSSKAQNLIRYTIDQGRLTELSNAIITLRPHIKLTIELAKQNDPNYQSE